MGETTKECSLFYSVFDGALLTIVNMLGISFPELTHRWSFYSLITLKDWEDRSKVQLWEDCLYESLYKKYHLGIYKSYKIKHTSQILKFYVQGTFLT